MSVFDMANVFGRLLLTAIVIYKLSQFRDQMIALERIGLGIMGAGSFLTIPIIIDRNGNPFNGWAVSLLTFGAIIFISGRVLRDRKHDRANQQQIHAAREHLKARGKL